MSDASFRVYSQQMTWKPSKWILWQFRLLLQAFFRQVGRQNWANDVSAARAGFIWV